MFNNKKQKINHLGFTLAEILIALITVAVLSMLAIPTIKNLLPDSNKAMVRKAYKTLKTAISNMAGDDENYPSYSQDYLYGRTSSDPEYLYERVFNYSDTTASIPSGVEKFCYLLTEQLNTSGSITCPASATVATTKFATTTDGMDWYIYYNSGTYFPISPTVYNTKIIIDVNGSKSPNCLTDPDWNTYKPTDVAHTSCTSNPDTFIIGVRYDGQLQIGSGGDDTGANAILMDPLNNQK